MTTYWNLWVLPLQRRETKLYRYCNGFSWAKLTAKLLLMNSSTWKWKRYWAQVVRLCAENVSLKCIENLVYEETWKNPFHFVLYNYFLWMWSNTWASAESFEQIIRDSLDMAFEIMFNSNVKQFINVSVFNILGISNHFEGSYNCEQFELWNVQRERNWIVKAAISLYALHFVFTKALKLTGSQEWQWIFEQLSSKCRCLHAVPSRSTLSKSTFHWRNYFYHPERKNVIENLKCAISTWSKTDFMFYITCTSIPVHWEPIYVPWTSLKYLYCWIYRSNFR